MTAISWLWGHHDHRVLLESLRQEVLDIKSRRRDADETLRQAKLQQAASKEVIARAHRVAESNAKTIEQNHFTELFRAAMRPK